MVNKIISDLESVVSVAGDMLLPVENGAGTFAASVDDIKNYIKKALQDIATTATAAGTTTLTNASARHQNFTGSTTQTAVLPNATTLEKGDFFDVSNQSTGVVTVNMNGGSLSSAVVPGGVVRFKLLDNATAAGTWIVIQLVAGYYFRTTQYFTSSGTWTKPAGCRAVEIEVIGGGGQGGSVSAGNPSTGGGGGGYSYKFITSGLGSTETVTIGAGGSGGTTAQNGGNGGSSSFGSHATAAGGTGGKNNSASGSGGGGLGSGGDINMRGGDGGLGTNTTLVGHGSAAPRGGAATGAGNGGQGGTGCNYGGGGGASNGSFAGGVGAAGIIVVKEYY